MTKIYEWDNEDLSITLDGIEVDNFQSFRYNIGKKISHIRDATKGVTGYNRVFEEPTWELTYNATANIHEHVLMLKRTKGYFNIQFGTSSFKVDAYNCIIQDANPGSTGTDSPTVTVTGLALKIVDEGTDGMVDGAE